MLRIFYDGRGFKGKLTQIYVLPKRLGSGADHEKSPEEQRTIDV